MKQEDIKAILLNRVNEEESFIANDILDYNLAVEDLFRLCDLNLDYYVVTAEEDYMGYGVVQAFDVYLPEIQCILNMSAADHGHLDYYLDNVTETTESLDALLTKDIMHNLKYLIAPENDREGLKEELCKKVLAYFKETYSVREYCRTLLIKSIINTLIK